LCTRLQPLTKRIEKIPQRPISTVIVDMQMYTIFRITDYIAAVHFVDLLNVVQKAGETDHFRLRKWSLYAHHITKMLYRFLCNFLCFCIAERMQLCTHVKLFRCVRCGR